MAREITAATLADAERAAAELGYPLWVRSCGSADPRYCAHLASPDDLPLAFAQAARRSPEGFVLLQPAGEGRCYRIWVPKEGAEHAVCFDAHFSHLPPYRLCAGLSRCYVLPEGLLIPDSVASLDSPWVEIEAVQAADELVITGMWKADMPHPVAARLMDQQAGATAAWWFHAGSGKVTGIAGETLAREARGVKDIVVSVQVGDMLRHTVDEAGRDRLGYVRAAGDDAAQAIENARRAAGLVVIQTTVMLD